MNVNDLIALAKAGYTPEFLTKLLGVETEEKKEIELPKEPEPEPEPQPDPKPEPEPEPHPEPQPEPEIDYKALYEEEQKKVKKLQAQNVQKDISGAQLPTSVEEHVLGIFKDFFN